MLYNILILINPLFIDGYGNRASHMQAPYVPYPQYTLEQQQAYAAQVNAYNNAAAYYQHPVMQYYAQSQPSTVSEPEPPAKRGRTNTYSVKDLPYTPQPLPKSQNNKNKGTNKQSNQNQSKVKSSIPERPNFPSNNIQQQQQAQQQQSNQHNPNKRSHNTMSASSNSNPVSRANKRQAQSNNSSVNSSSNLKGKQSSNFTQNSKLFQKGSNKNTNNLNGSSNDDKRRTLTDFRITSISIPDIDWHWKQNENMNIDKESKEAKESSKEMARLRLYFSSPASLDKKRGNITSQKNVKKEELPSQEGAVKEDDKDKVEVKDKIEEKDKGEIVEVKVEKNDKVGQEIEMKQGEKDNTSISNQNEGIIVDEVDNKIREIEESLSKTDNKLTEPSSNRISISYDYNTRRLVLDAELIEGVEIYRKEAKVKISLLLKRPQDPFESMNTNSIDKRTLLPEKDKLHIMKAHNLQIEKDKNDHYRICPGVLVESYNKDDEIYVPIQRNSNEEADEKNIPPFKRLYDDNQSLYNNNNGLPKLKKDKITIICDLETKQPLTEPRWVRNGDIEEWIEQTVSGASLNYFKHIIAKEQHMAARIGWNGKINVVDPDPPPSFIRRFESWLKQTYLGSFNDRKKFLKIWFNVTIKSGKEKEKLKIDEESNNSNNHDKNGDKINKFNSNIDENSHNNNNDNDNVNVNNDNETIKDDDVMSTVGERIIEDDNASVSGELSEMVKDLEGLARDNDSSINDNVNDDMENDDENDDNINEDYESSQKGVDAAVEIMTRLISIPTVSQSITSLILTVSHIPQVKEIIVEQVKKLPQNLFNKSLDFAFRDYLRLVKGKSRYR